MRTPLIQITLVALIVFALGACVKVTDTGGASGDNCDGSDTTDGTTDPFFTDQWHFTSLGIGTTHNSVKGTNILVAVVDDGLDIVHEDLAVNVKSNAGLNFWTGTAGFSSSATNPQHPTGNSHGHGTCVAGLIAARDLNDVGGKGLAPRACLAGINLIANGGTTSTQDATAMTHNVANTGTSNNSWGPTDRMGDLATSSAAWRTGIDSGLSTGRGGLGTVYIWAAGNGARTTEGNGPTIETDNSNYDGFANYYGVLSTCAVDDTGERAYYSEKGANLWVCGAGNFSTFASDLHGTTTTDVSDTSGLFNARTAKTSTNITVTSGEYNHGSYTRRMNGTSGAAPTVTGAVALALEANPNLTYRDVALLLAESATKNDATDTDWTTNAGTQVSAGGGYDINHKYGFGTVDPEALFLLASTWVNVSAALTPYDSGTVTVSSAFSDNNATGATNAIVVSANSIARIEFIEVTLTQDADIRDIRVELTGSAGTTSVLAEEHDCYTSSSDTTPESSCGQTHSAWRFGTARHLGETANQTWTLRVADRRAGNANGGTFTSWRLIIRGRAS